LPLAESASNYWKLTKPRIWGLLVFTGFVAMLVAYKETGRTPSFAPMVTLVVALTLGSASADVLTNYHDRDIDRVMKRTMKRTLPSGQIRPTRALVFGLVMAFLSVTLAAWFNILAAGFMAIGLLDNVVVYSLVLKRRSWLSVILGGISGGMPVLVGYAAVANGVSPIALYMSVLVIVWIPTHIWSLAIANKEDYVRAKVPMLPVVFGDRVGAVCIAATSALLAAFSMAIFLFATVSVLYTLSVIVLGAIVIAYSAKLALERSLDTAWALFKITSPYLALIFSVLGFTIWF
jgi:protoheme IX farnesyltransferase